MVGMGNPMAVIVSNCKPRATVGQMGFENYKPNRLAARHTGGGRSPGMGGDGDCQGGYSQNSQSKSNI